MAELPASVTDTHALLFHAGGGRSLGAKATAHFRAAEEGRALIYVPMAVLLEVTFLARVGRGRLRVTPAQILGLPLITRDVNIVASKAVKVIW